MRNLILILLLASLASPAFGQADFAAGRLDWKKLAAFTALHVSATFDAYSTRRILTHVPPGSCREANPVMRPFAGSAAIYPAINLMAFGADIWALRARGSFNRKAAWAALFAQTGAHVFCGIHNLRLENHLYDSAAPRVAGRFDFNGTYIETPQGDHGKNRFTTHAR